MASPQLDGVQSPGIAGLFAVNVRHLPDTTGLSGRFIKRALRAGELLARGSGRNRIVERPEICRWLATLPVAPSKKARSGTPPPDVPTVHPKKNPAPRVIATAGDKETCSNDLRSAAGAGPQP